MTSRRIAISAGAVGFPTLLLAFTACLATPLHAAAQAQPNLAQATLEELMEIRVTSASRRSQLADDVPAAVYVITRQDIRRSGLHTLPELLRLAPGVQVARLNANKWAISIRGFNDLYSNKLLVLVDGRSVYSRSFSGVLWDLQDVVVADIDRIEIVRGSGGVAWGANAVNGVINIITRPASETQGVALETRVGSLDREVGIRYGGTLGATAYRVFAEWSGSADTGRAAPLFFDDGWDSLTGGVRADWSSGAHALFAQSYVTTNTTRPGWLALPAIAPGIAPRWDGTAVGHEANALLRWTYTGAADRVLQVQAYHTTTHRHEPILGVSEQSSDVDLQYERALGRHSLVLGGGYRHVDVSVENTVSMQIAPDRTDTANAFLQDEIALGADVRLTLGAKLEHDSLGGWGFMPSARMMWQATPRQHLWSAVSRARRTPSLTDRDFRVNLGVLPGEGLPVTFGYSGNPDYQSEEALQIETGYRVRLGSAAAVDVAAFTSGYDRLLTSEPLAPRVVAGPGGPHVQTGVVSANLLNARASGVEVAGYWSPQALWRLDGSVSLLHDARRVDLESRDTTAAEHDGNAPGRQWQLRTWLLPRPGLSLSGSVARVGGLAQLAVPAYTRVDARVELVATRSLTLALVGQNLADRRHSEFASPILFLTTEIPRSVRFDARWAF